MTKQTGELDFELASSEEIGRYMAANADEFDDQNFYSLLNSLAAGCGKSKARIAADSCVSEPYLYNLLNKEKRPTRDTVIKLAFGLRLSLETAERLLKLAGYSGFYVRHRRDAILKFAILNRLSLIDADILLGDYGFSIMTE